MKVKNWNSSCLWDLIKQIRKHLNWGERIEDHKVSDENECWWWLDVIDDEESWEFLRERVSKFCEDKTTGNSRQ